MTLLPELRDAVTDASVRYDVPIELFEAIIAVESGGNPYAVRVEPAYRWLWDCAEHKPYRAQEAGSRRAPSSPPFTPPRGLSSSRDTEWIGQQTSWGPMQIMGATARELGFLGYFPELCGPVGVDYGARLLQRMATRWLDEHGWEGVAAAYNAGSPRRAEHGGWSNQGYVDKVAAHWRGLVEAAAVD